MVRAPSLVSVSMMTSRLRKVQSDASLQFPYQRFLEALNERTKLIMVASPNNPTGATISREQLLALAAAAPQAVLMVDEAYFHFDGETAIGDIGTIPNLIIARTFSKAYGLANLRIGLLMGDANVIKYVRKVSSPYNVNGVALDCLPVALAGPKSPQAAAFYGVAEKLMVRAEAAAAAASDVIEIS